MANFTVCAELKIIVYAHVEADDEDQARSEAISAILNKDCDFMEPVDEPEINWVEFQCDDCENTDLHDHCDECGEINFNGDSICVQCQMADELERE